MAQDRYSQNRQLAYDLLKKEGYTDIGKDAEELFKNKDNSKIAYKLLSEAGYSDVGKDYDEFASMLYGPETKQDSNVEPLPVEAQASPELSGGDINGSVEPIKQKEVREQRKAEQKKQDELARAQELEALKATEQEDSSFISEYDRRWKQYQDDTNNELSGPEVDAEKQWLDDNNMRYRDAKKNISRMEGLQNYATKEEDINRLETKKKENQAHVARKVISTGGMTPGYDAYANRGINVKESANYEAANEILSMAEQTYKQGSKVDPGYDGNWLEQSWTAARQFVEGGANNVDMGSLTFGLSEGSALIQARRVGDKYNKIANQAIRDLGYSEADVNKLFQSFSEDAKKLSEIGEELNAQSAELETMKATLDDMRKNGESPSQIRAYSKQYNDKVNAYNAKLKKDYPQLVSSYEKDYKQYETIKSAVDSSLEDGLSDGERAILDALEEFTTAKIRRANDVSVASAAGAGAEQSAEFMLDFILTGGLEGANTKLVGKWLGKEAAKKAGIGATIAADVITAAERTAIMFPRNLSAYGEQLTQMTGGQDQFGRYNFDRTHLNAALNTATTQYIEYWSEGFGKYFGEAEKAFFQNVTKAAPKTAIGKTLKGYRGSIGTYLDNGKFDSLFNEMMEEVVGSALNATVGWLSGDRQGDSQALKEFASGEQLATLFFSFLPMSAISANTNIRAYKKMKARYDDGVNALNPFLESGAISRDELDELVTDIENKTPEEIKDKIIDISDKARKANGGYLPEDFAQNLMGYVEGTFSMSLNSDKWDDSQERMGVVYAYTSQYDNPDERNAWDLAQAEQETKAELIATGYSEEDLNKDAYMLAREASLSDNPELQRYAEIKAANEGLKDGYDQETAEYSKKMSDAIEQKCDINGNIIQAVLPNGEQVFIISKDAKVGADGKLTTPSGADGIVSYISPDGREHMEKASAFTDVTTQDTTIFLIEKEDAFQQARDLRFQQAQNTISPRGMSLALYQNVGHSVYVTGNGAYEPVTVVRLTNEGQNVVISGDKEALKGVALAVGINSPGGTNLEIPVQSFYPMLATNDDGTLATDAPEAAPDETDYSSESQAPQNLKDLEDQILTVNFNGKPTEVLVDYVDGERGVSYYTKDENGEFTMLNPMMPLEEFQQAMGIETDPAEVPAPQPAETSAIPVDAKTGEPIYDAENITPEQAYDDIYSKLSEKNADMFVIEQAKGAETSLAEAQKLVTEGDKEKAEIDAWEKKPGEGIGAFLKRQADAKAKVDAKIGAAQASLPELQRKAAFWNELREVADENTKARDKEKARQALIDKYGVDTTGFYKAPAETAEEAVAEYLGNNESIIDLDDAKKEIFGKSGRVPSELFRHVGNGGILTKKGGRTIADVANDIVGEYEGQIAIAQDQARDLIIDYLARYTKKEMRELIFNNRLQAAIEAKRAAEEAPEEIVPEGSTSSEEDTAEEDQEPEDDLPPAEPGPVPEPEQEPQPKPTPGNGGAETAPGKETKPSGSEKKPVSSQKENKPKEAEKPAPEAPKMLTEEEIRNSGFPDENVIEAAIDYINGSRGVAETLAYNQIEEYVRPQRRTTEQTGSNADKTQLDGPVVQPAGVGAEQSGGEAGRVGELQERGNSERVPGNPDGGVPSGVRSAADATGAGLPADGVDTGSERRGGGNRPGQSGRSNAEQAAGSESAPVAEQPSGREGGAAGVDNSGRSGRSEGPDERRGVSGSNAQSTAEGSTDIEALGSELEDLLKQFQDTNHSISRGGPGAVDYSTSPEQKEEGSLSLKQPKRPTVPLSLEGLTPQQMQLAGKILFSSAKLGYAFAKTEGLTTFNDFRRWFTAKFGDAVMKGLNYNESSLDAFIREVWNTKMRIDGERLTLEQHAQELHNEELREQSQKTPGERAQLQKAANAKKVPFVAANRKNIAEALPQLIPGQWDDVVAIERQFFDPYHNDYDHAYGKGMLITNGTGTGKTYTGLGTIKRFLDQGKGRILLVAPAGMTDEWVTKANAMGIKATKLSNTKDKGKGVVVTSYENFRENKALYEDDFDLVVYDECQNIIENQQADDTLAFEAHKRITNKNVEEATERLVSNTEQGRRRQELLDEQKRLEAEARKRSTREARRDAIVLRLREIEAELQAVQREINSLKPQFAEKAAAAVGKTKVLFLSATPFNTVRNLRIAEGYIFNYPKVFRSDGTEITDEQSGQSAFATEWFRGDESMEDMEIAFGDHLLNDLETASYRELENGFDHSRDFPDVSGNVMAARFNAAWQAIQVDPRFRELQDYARFLTNPTWNTQLFETMKVSAIRDRLEEHLNAGRKIVIFHNRTHETNTENGNLPPVGPPFATVLEQALLASSQGRQTPVTAIAEFRAKFADVLAWEQTLDYRPVHQQVVDLYATDSDRARFEQEMVEYQARYEQWIRDCAEYERTHPSLTPEELAEKLPKAPKRPELKAESVAVYNGEKSNKEKDAAKAAFNDDDSKVKIICVTTRSGGAGLSLHDTTGKHPRVMIQTALPVSPIGFIQAEGRIFRWGNRSNAVFEYPRLGIDLEAYVFAMQFNAKAETVENLAHGFRGRGLKDSIMTGFYENSGNVPIDGQGIGGVEMDKRGNTLKGMAKAKHDYGVAERKGVKEGDHSIPEPVGFKMAEWAKSVPGDSALVPHAGRGSITRYIPKGVSVSALEQDAGLQTDLMVTASDGANFKIREGSFAELNMINKADVVLLNGATEKGGLDEIDTFKKGYGHLSEGGRLVAIIPDNAAANNAIAEITGNLGGALRVSIKVPNAALDRGEGASRIVIIDKISSAQLRSTAGQTITQDLSTSSKEQVFDALENINVPERIIDKKAIAIKKLRALATEFKKNKLVSGYSVEDGVTPAIFIEFGRRPAGMSSMKRRPEDMQYDGYYRTAPRYWARLSDFENPNPSHAYIKRYQVLGEVLQMDDEAFRKFALLESGAKQEDVEALRDLYRSYQKMIRAAFGLTESQIKRIIQGLRPDVSASDIETLNSYDELRAKFEACNHDDAERQEMYDRVAQVGEQLGLTIGAESMDRDFLGGYNNRDNSLKINRLRWNGLSDDKRAETLLHEFIHSVTVYAMAAYDSNAAGMSDALFNAAKLASDVFDQIQRGAPQDVRPFTGFYALENVKELLAEMANNEFRDKLKNRRMWVQRSDRGVRVSGAELEGAEQTTAWELLNEALDGMLQNFDKSLFDRFRNRVSSFFWNLDRNGKPTRKADYGRADENSQNNTNFVEDDTIRRIQTGTGESSQGNMGAVSGDADQRGSGSMGAQAAEAEREASSRRLDVLQRGLAAERGEYLDESNRAGGERSDGADNAAERNAGRKSALGTAEEALVRLAKDNGFYLDPLEIRAKYGKEHGKQGYESVTLVSDDGKVFTKLKDPFRVYTKFDDTHTPFDVVNEVIAHNIIFPATAYRLLGVTVEGGRPRLVLQQDAVEYNTDANTRQMASWYAEHGFDFNRWSENGADENVRISDTDGRNSFVSPDGKVRVIDPMLHFLTDPAEAVKNLREKLSGVGEADISAHSENHPLMADITNAYERLEYESDDENWIEKAEEFYDFLKEVRPKLNDAQLGTIEDVVADEIDRLLRSYPDLGKVAQYKDFFKYDVHGLYSVASAYVDKPERRELGAQNGENGVRYRQETDEDVLERLESEPTVTAYRAMQFVPDPNGDWEFDLGDGRGMQKGFLYPPMSAQVDGKWRNPVSREKWERSEERPDLADDKGQFRLYKGNGKWVPARYNPYFHSSDTMLNDQFAEAQTRPNLVVVEVKVPAREVADSNMNPYHAEKAKDSVGRHEWKAGPIQQQLTGTRNVYLSRWDKPTRIVPVNEVADNVAAMINGRVKEMPSNVVWPQLRSELEKRGVKFVETDNQGKYTEGEKKGKSYASENKRVKTRQEDKEAKAERKANEARVKAMKQAERMSTEKTLDRMGDELGIKNNRVGRDQMPMGHKSDKGFYDTKTGEMTICMDNVTDERDAIATVLHETVGHHGLRKLLGDRFNDAMVRIYAALDEKGRRWVNSYIARHSDADNVRAVEEYLSHLAESGDYMNVVWRKVKEILGKIVDALFGTNGFLLTDNELNYILRASYENLKNPNWLNTAEGRAFDTLLKRQLGINETDPNRPTDPEGPGAGRLYRDGDTGVANVDYNAEMDLRRTAALIENQDADRPVRIGMDKMMAEYKKNTGKDYLLPEDEDYLVRHNLASSRAESEAHNFELFQFSPLLDQVRAIRDKLLVGKKSSRDERQDAYEKVLDYMYAVSGLERNAYKNAEIEQGKQDALNAARTAGATAAELDKIEKKYEAMKKDWSGLTSLMGLNPSLWQLAEARAQGMIDDFKAKVGDDAMLDELWDRIRACTDFSLEHAYSHGLLTKAEYEKLHGTETQPRMWNYYLPLRGFAEETAEEEFGYANFTNPSTNSVVVKKMNGRWTEADNPIANILNIAETEIVQGNDNLAKQALLKFVRGIGENSLLAEVEPWYEKNPATGKWSLAEPNPGESLHDFEERMKALRAMPTPLAKKGRKGLKLDNIMVNKAHRNEHLIRLKVGGMDKMIWVNGNPALARAVSGIGRAQNLQWIRRASRALSNLFTTYSLDFTAKNLIRDTIYSSVALLVKEDREYRHQYWENWYRNLGYGAFAYPMVKLAHDWDAGKLQAKDPAKRTKREQMFIDFMMDGGQTGYTIVNSVSEIKRSLERSMRKAGSKSGTFPVLGHYAKAVKTLNEAFELLTRFTTYETSRDMGRSGQRSASDAKEISVNFNRRGAQSGEGVWGNIAAYLGATHYFYNAGVQGFDNFLKLYKASPVTMSTATGALVLMGVLTPLINGMLAGGGDGDDEDWYWNLPEWVRRNNIILGTGKWYLAVPLPVEFRAIYGIGDIIGASFCYEKTPNRTFGSLAGDIISTASGILPVNPIEGYTGGGNLGDAALRAVAPDAGMFFVDWATNRDYTGRPLWKENPFSETKPKSQGAYASTPKGIVWACQKLAEVSGGNIDVAPGLIRDFANNYGGGFFRAAEDASKIFTGIFGNDPERPLRWDNVPFFSGFTGHIDKDRSNSFTSNTLREYKNLSENNVKKLNSICNTDDLTIAMIYGDEPLPEKYASKVNMWKTLHPKEYNLGKMYHEGMNNEYVMKQYMTGPKMGQWYKSREKKRDGVNPLKKNWKALRDQWVEMPDKTQEEKDAKAAFSLEVQNAWHLYYDAKSDLAERLLNYEYGKDKQ